MKKIFLIIVFQFIIICANAQLKSKPTKEETMEWIASKFRKYLVTPRIFINCQNGFFRYKKTHEGKIHYTIINLNNITESNYGYATSGNYEIYFVKGINLFGKGGGEEQFTFGCKLDAESIQEFNNDHDGNILININMEAGLIDRMKTALELLINYNLNPVTNEKF